MRHLGGFVLFQLVMSGGLAAEQNDCCQSEECSPCEHQRAQKVRYFRPSYPRCCYYTPDLCERSIRASYPTRREDCFYDHFTR